ncbi:hypothetical protein B0H19DRAFT_1263003 [Mycena capillaripes]|nr:hypothetical protein B0H19DRAFT_1263003 [Mycena capillaripes]
MLWIQERCKLHERRPAQNNELSHQGTYCAHAFSVHQTPAATSAPTDRPWAPFRTYADFKFISRQIKRWSPNVEIDEDLLGLRDGSLPRDSLVTFRNHRDMEKVLAAARVSNVAFECKTLTIGFEGTSLGSGTYNVDVEFRDPWSIMKQ